jgi:RNA polymerase sigma-70 factor (ECF subfamily)
MAAAPPPEVILQEYGQRVYNLARRTLHNPADAEDVTQDVFVQVLRKLPTFRGEAAFSSWLYRLAVNTILAFRRKQAIRTMHPLPDPLEEFHEDGSHRVSVGHWTVTAPEQLAIDHETHQRIEEAIARLPESYRDAYVLADIEERTNAEIAEFLGLSVSAVKSRLHRARLLMRQALAPHFEEQAA